MSPELIQIGKQVPPQMLKELSKVNGERAFVTYTESSMTAFVVLDGIQKSELKEFKGTVTVIYQDFEVPMLVLKYKKASFDMPLTYHGDFLPNALNIYLIELNGFIMKQIRVVGLDEEISSAMAKGIEKTKGLSSKEVLTKVSIKIYPFHTAEQMCKGGVRQVFMRT